MAAARNSKPKSRAHRVDQKSFVEQIRVDHGPHEILGRFFLNVDTLLRSRGLLASFAPARQFVETNEANFATWGRLIPPRWTSRALCRAGCHVHRMPQPPRRDRRHSG
jgi:hypothetical protein